MSAGSSFFNLGGPRRFPSQGDKECWPGNHDDHKFGTQMKITTKKQKNKKRVKEIKSIRQNKVLIQVRISIVDFNAKNVSVSE